MAVPPLLVRDPDGEVTHVVDLDERPLRASTLVATSVRDKFLPLDEAIEHRPDVVEALLGLSPDEKLSRWANVGLRSIVVGAPFAWTFYCVSRWRDAVTIPRQRADAYYRDNDASQSTTLRRTDGARLQGDLVEQTSDHVTLVVVGDKPETIYLPSAAVQSIAPTPGVIVKTTTGVEHQGTLLELVRDDHITLDEAGARTTIAWADADSMKAQAGDPRVTLTLTDASTLRGELYELVPGARVAVEVAPGESLVVPGASIARLEVAAEQARANRPKIERLLAMQEADVLAEIGMLVAAVVVIALSLRRWRPIPIALGAAACVYFVVQAGRPGHCFRHAGFEWFVAAAGALGAIAALFLAPGESRVLARLRARLAIPQPIGSTGPLLGGERRYEVAATLGAAGAGLILPVLLAKLPGSDVVRISFFVVYCTGIFLGFLAWRRERARSTPRFVQLALAATLGFGILSASALAMNGSFAVAVEVEQCAAPGKEAATAKIQAAGEDETKSARRNSQLGFLAFFVPVFVSPICEELLYRGALQRVARRAFGSRIAMLVSGVVFGLAHMSAFQHAFYQHIGLGLAFGAIFELAGGGPTGVVASAATHVAWNLWLSVKPVM